MPRGRKPDYDAKIASLLDELRDAIVAREKAAMDARVSAQLRPLIGAAMGWKKPASPQLALVMAGVPKAPATRKRKPMSAAQKKAVGERMKKYWAERRKQKAGKA